MLTIEKELPGSCGSLPKLFGGPEGLLFFDIETTGFSRDHHSVYLIGCLVPGAGGSRLIQWFADRPEEEAAVIGAFFRFAAGFALLVDFNGRQFDLPFLRHRAGRLGVEVPSSLPEDLDLFREIRPYASLLGLGGLRQKKLEAFLGISREDRYDGGRLIPVYEEYLRTGQKQALRLLLLHNEEDLSGLTGILSFLLYPRFLENAAFAGHAAAPDGSLAVLRYESACSVPRPVNALWIPDRNASGDPGEYPGISLAIDENRAVLSIPLIRGEMRRFYKDYRNYYYLIYEDCAIHKSVGRYVDKSARKPATAKTCYTKVQGIFVPDPLGLFPVSLKQDYGAHLSCAPYDDTLFADPGTALALLRAAAEHGIARSAG